MKKILIATLALLVGQVASAAAPFGTLVCKRVIGDTFTLQTKTDRISVKWVNRGGEDVVQLLRAVTDKAIPTSLLKAYGDVQVEFSMPLTACKFTGPGKLACDYKKADKTIALKISAKVSPYDFDVAPDVYEGKMSSVSLKSVFSGKKDARELKFPMEFAVESPSVELVKAESDFFYAHAWSSEGFRQNPSCQVDGAFIVD